VRKDGRWFWASVVIDAIRDNDGRLIGFAKVTRDLTDR
jgi:PAS domain S-box-containing protein